MKLFNSKITKLSKIFKVESKYINLFNDKLLEKAKQSGWMEAGENVITISDSSGTPRNLITQYRIITVKKAEANMPN